MGKYSLPLGAEFGGDDAVRQFVPKSRTIIDFGCYRAAQAWLLDDYKAYIGVDICDGTRFKPPNARHYVMPIQDFIPMLGWEYEDAFAICSYVPDDEAMKMVRESFNDCLVYYPTII